MGGRKRGGIGNGGRQRGKTEGEEGKVLDRKGEKGRGKTERGKRERC
jgi:hypothetical protein